MARFQPHEWSQAGKSLACCSGLACVLLAFHREAGIVQELLRTWVGLFGLLVFALDLRAGRGSAD